MCSNKKIEYAGEVYSFNEALKSILKLHEGIVQLFGGVNEVMLHDQMNYLTTPSGDFKESEDYKYLQKILRDIKTTSDYITIISSEVLGMYPEKESRINKGRKEEK